MAACSKAGVAEFMLKPFSIQKVTQLAEAVLARKAAGHPAAS
jgi:DNA-binding NtrC family response regulator